MRRLGFVLGFLFMVSPGLAWAACTAAEIREMIGQGLSDEEIEQRCDRAEEIPGWLSGDWQVAQTIEGSSVPGWGYPPFTLYWRIEAGADGTLAIAKVHDAHLAGTGFDQVSPLEVRDARVSGGRLTFTTRERIGGSINTDAYELDLSGEQDLVIGRWRSRSVASSGSVEMWGTVQMIKN